MRGPAGTGRGGISMAGKAEAQGRRMGSGEGMEAKSAKKER